MSVFRRYARYLMGTPALYKIYRHPPSSITSPSTPPPNPPTYTPSFIESITTVTISYVVPLTLILSLYHRKIGYIQFALMAYITSQLLRSFTRLTSSEYKQFLRILEKATDNPDAESLENLRCYDFEFKYFPVLHSCSVDVSSWVERQQVDSGLMYYVSWLIAHSFGIRLIYPGLLLGGVLKNVLDEGREKLVNEKRGLRVKIRSESQHGGSVDVDACAFDKRGSNKGNGDVLVICCEGNAGFYEIGMLGGALSEGFSVLGWNHPGFGGSTGVPYPPIELTAALGVMDYALNVMGFREDQIIVYGWSIGGFPATYLASRYPGVRGLLLDATFDDILPLAIPRMPEFMSSLVVSTIRNHVNLQNTQNLENYTGPLRIIRRTDDEIIADPPGQIKANRGNQLLVDVVLRRVGNSTAGSVASLNEWVNVAHDRDQSTLDCLSTGECGGGKDNLIGVASSILRDYKSTHCTPLPREYYRIRN